MDKGLPASIEAAWGLRERSVKGPKPGLSLDQIVEAGVAIAMSEGLAAVSMGRVATQLGAATMSLYRYVKTKDELLALMVDAAFKTAPEPATAREPWRRAVSRWAIGHLAVLRRHPWIIRVPIGGPPLLPNQMIWFERGLLALRGADLTEAQRLGILLLVNGFVRNDALLTADLQQAADDARQTRESAGAAYGQMLARLLDPQRFPALSAVIAAGVFEQPDDPDADFAFGLERILDGVAALVQTRASAAKRRTTKKRAGR